MKDRIERQITKRTQMLAMISHDLRTPLTRMKLQLELMADSEEKEGFKQDIESMQQMINSYLDFARGEGGEEFEVISISPWIAELINKKWRGFDIDFMVIESQTKVQIKPLSFERAISNLITNSIKYATKIKISVYTIGANVIIEIDDNGIGIKDEEKNLSFKPFYRSDKSRSLDNAGNVGLGLTITKEIVTGHYGNISLENSRDLGGLLVKITLPAIG
jgi:two-component system osmolarity sensor histidine kinase EnvZ